MHISMPIYVPYGRLSRATKRVIFVFTCFALSLITLDMLMNRRGTERKFEEELGDNVADFESLLSYIRHPSTLCETALSLGGKPDSIGRVDGDKIICQHPGPPLRNPCLVYSFGSNDEWSFEEAVEKFDCKVFTFDPSLKQSTFRHSQNIWFYRIGISDVIEDKFLLKEKITWHMRTLNYIRRHLGHVDEVIDILKLDIEGDEWKVLQQLMDSSELKRVNHLCVEIHLNSMDWTRKKKLLQRLEKQGGFRFFSSKKNLVTPPKRVPGIPNKTEQLFYELAWFKDSG